MLKKYRKSRTQIADLPQTLELSVKDGQQLLQFSPELIESVRYMATRLLYQKTFPSRLALVSALRQEGVTFVSRALATVLANDTDSKVCVVELNWWWPDDSMTMTPKQGGLADVLSNKTSLQDTMLPTNISNLFILPSGKMPRNERPVWARSERLNELITELNQQYDYLILDVPAILATTDSIPLASLAIACGLVVNQGVTSFENTRLAIDEISHLSIAGVVLNKVKMNTPSWILKFIPQDPGPVSSI